MAGTSYWVMERAGFSRWRGKRLHRGTKHVHIAYNTELSPCFSSDRLIRVLSALYCEEFFAVETDPLTHIHTKILIVPDCYEFLSSFALFQPPVHQMTKLMLINSDEYPRDLFRSVKWKSEALLEHQGVRLWTKIASTYGICRLECNYQPSN